jgi:hypothetical protein
MKITQNKKYLWAGVFIIVGLMSLPTIAVDPNKVVTSNIESKRDQVSQVGTMPNELVVPIGQTQYGQVMYDNNIFGFTSFTELIAFSSFPYFL